jgi:hypothetical protein
MFFQAWGSRRNQPNAIGSISARSGTDSGFSATFKAAAEILNVFTIPAGRRAM